MAQLTVTEQDTHIKTKYAWFDYRWMRYFFSEDTSVENYPTLDLQRRAVWIAVALLLLGLNEVDHSWYMPYLGPFGSLIPLALHVDGATPGTCAGRKQARRVTEAASTLAARRLAHCARPLHFRLHYAGLERRVQLLGTTLH